MMTIANSREPFALQAGDLDGLANLDWLVMLYADSPRTLPSVSPVMVWVIRLTVSSKTSAGVSQLSPTLFHCTR